MAWPCSLKASARECVAACLSITGTARTLSQVHCLSASSVGDVVIRASVVLASEALHYGDWLHWGCWWCSYEGGIRTQRIYPQYHKSPPCPPTPPTQPIPPIPTIPPMPTIPPIPPNISNTLNISLSLKFEQAHRVVTCTGADSRQSWLGHAILKASFSRVCCSLPFSQARLELSARCCA